jgi:trehalose-phosphatase
VAKQLPLLTKPGPDGKFVIEDPATGSITLAHQEWEDNRSFLSGLRSLREDGYNVTWVGVPNTGGKQVGREEQEQYEELLAEHDCVPVFMTADLSEKYFNGFCKGVLWPMLHYVLPQSNHQFSAQWDELWQAYNAANAAFSTVIARCVETQTDTIWVHNYHLLLLPSLLRRKLPRAKIGIFIHTPFPSSDVFRVLPTRHNILSSIMAADLLGFHTFDYARHFLSCIKRVMDLDFETLPGGSLGIKYSGRFVSILISHVGIDSAMFQEVREDRGILPSASAGGQTVEQEVAALKAKHQGRRIVISAGDLDSVKGGLLKFQAYSRFFSRFPQWREKIVFLEMLMPNRSVRLDHVQDLAELLEEQVQLIHSTWGAACLEVLHLKEQLPLRSTVALYAAADVCIASQFWDGLNLLPFEYTASQRDQSNPGALIISEFMGCSRSLSGVLRVNPWNLDDVAEALNAALGLSQNERVINHQRRYKYVMDHTIVRWGRGFLQHLDRATKLCEGMNYVQVGWGSNVKLVGLRSDFTHLDEESVTAAYRRAERRVLLLDYDGTLTPAEKTAVKSRLMGPSKQVKKLLHSLTSDPENVVFIMSGRTRSTLTEWFPSSEYPELGLAAEKGLFLRFPRRLMTACRQDVRRDPMLKRRVEMRQVEMEEKRQADLKANAEKTSESRTAAFLKDKQKSSYPLSLDLSSPSDEKYLSPPPTSDSPMPGLSGDAHLLIEPDAIPVEEMEWEYMIALDDVSWKQMALEIIRSYTEQTDGSWIEPKEFAIVWHYEQADPEYGRMQASELQKYLVKILANPNVDVVRYDYNRILEVKPHGVSKGLAATAILEELFMLHTEKLKASRPPSPKEEETGGESIRSNRTSHTNLSSLDRSSSPRSQSSVFQAGSPPFLFCVGDDRSDEDMVSGERRRIGARERGRVLANVC